MGRDRVAGLNRDRDNGVSFFTITDRAYFPGTVALFNSLHITGNASRFVVLDAGLTARQRHLLRRHAILQPLSASPTRPWLLKAFPRLVEPKGVIVIIDSDMIVTRSLQDVLEQARQGKICVYPDHVSQSNRWFKEWGDVLALQSPLRKQQYVNSGFIALSVDYWPHFLDRFAEILDRVPGEGIRG